MLKKRVIAVLTINDGILFRTRNFIPDYRYTSNFIDMWSIDELIILDVTRPDCGNRENFYTALENFAKNCYVPLSVGGKVTHIGDISTLLHYGADKVVINSEALKNPDFISQSSKKFGSQCIVLSIDAKRNNNGIYEVYISQGRIRTELEPTQWARLATELGAGEIMITSIDRDGTLEGYDLDLVRMVSENVSVPVLACGGAGNWEHFYQGFVTGKASGVCTTNIYHFSENSISSAKNYLLNKGICVRK